MLTSELTDALIAGLVPATPIVRHRGASLFWHCASLSQVAGTSPGRTSRSDRIPLNLQNKTKKRSKLFCVAKFLLDHLISDQQHVAR
jgi:hypothetical protein